MHIKKLIVFIIICVTQNSFAQPIVVSKVEPPNWWTGMQNDTLQIMVYGENLLNATVNCKSNGVKILNTLFDQNNYGFIDILLNKKTKAQNLILDIKTVSSKAVSIEYKILSKEGTSKPAGINNSDAVYLIMPDRFANGNAENDNVAGMEQKNNVTPDGRHGGDLQGITQHLDYIKDLGITAIWLTPFQEMNQAKGSYHHYGMSDFYNVDARFGNGNKNSEANNETYKTFVEKAHAQKLKVVMDVVLNHIGIDHAWMQSKPRLKNWVHDSVLCNFMIPAITDLYATDLDKQQMEKGWFVPSMPDLNHDNKRLCTYLIQNNIWWIAYAKLDAIRLDTQPFSKKEFTSAWALALKKEFPTLSIVGETWSADNKNIYTKYWQKNNSNKDNYTSNIESVMDFPFMENTIDALKNNDANKLYYTIASDFVYDTPNKNWITLGNHDTERFFTAIGENENKFKMGMTILATMRGIPQIYYGDEILTTGKKGINDGYMRTDMPGGWKGDTKNIFTQQGYNINDKTISNFNFVAALLKYRKTQSVLHDGKLVHFIPKNNVYAYYRYDNSSTAIMVICNFNNAAASVNLNEGNYAQLFNAYPIKKIIHGDAVTENNILNIPANTAQIIELQKRPIRK